MPTRGKYTGEVMREIKLETINTKVSQLETWIPGNEWHEKPELYSVTLPLNVALPLNKTPVTLRQKFARTCLRVLMPSLFSDFGDDTVIGLVAVRLASTPASGGENVYRLDREKSDFPTLELLFPARK